MKVNSSSYSLGGILVTPSERDRRFVVVADITHVNFMGFSCCISNWGHLDDRASVAQAPRDFSPLDGAERGSNRKFC